LHIFARAWLEVKENRSERSERKETKSQEKAEMRNFEMHLHEETARASQQALWREER
jgi:hypothetical protein